MIGNHSIVLSCTYNVRRQNHLTLIPKETKKKDKEKKERIVVRPRWDLVECRNAQLLDVQRRDRRVRRCLGRADHCARYRDCQGGKKGNIVKQDST